MNKPIRVLHVTGGMNPGGVETWLLQILKNINRELFSIDILSHTLDKCAYDDEIIALGSRIIACLDFSKPWSYAYNFKRIMNDYGPFDIIHAHMHRFNGFVLFLAHRAGIPVRIAHSRNTADRINYSLHRRLYNFVMEYWIDRYATHLLSISNSAGTALFGPKVLLDPRLTILTSAIDFAPFKVSVSAENIRNKLGIPSNAKVIGHVGRFEEQKNHFFLLEIAANLIPRQPNLRFLLVGDGALREKIEKKVREYGLTEHFIFTGVRYDIAQLMLGAMDIFLFPSNWEGLGRVVLEAQAAGLPCVISDVVPQESDAISLLVTRISLKEPVGFWADAVLDALNNKQTMRPKQTLSILEQGPFSIKSNVQTLELLYTTAYK